MVFDEYPELYRSPEKNVICHRGTKLLTFLKKHLGNKFKNISVDTISIQSVNKIVSVYSS